MPNTEISPFNLDEDSRTEAIIFNIQSPLNIEYWVFLACPYPLEVTRVMAETETGSLNVSLVRKRGATTTVLADFEEIPISGALATLTSSSDNTFIVDDEFYLLISNVTDATRLRLQIDFIRTYAQT